MKNFSGQLIPTIGYKETISICRTNNAYYKFLGVDKDVLHAMLISQGMAN